MPCTCGRGGVVARGRGKRVNGCNPSEMQEGTEVTRKVETVHKRSFSLKVVLLKCAV
jgi:hypothetical protein